MDQPRHSLLTSGPSDLAHDYDAPILGSRRVDHAAALEASRALCRSYATMYPNAGFMADPLLVIKLLQDAGVRFVLLGAHGIGGWLQQARATRDVDVVVRKSDHKKAIRAISEGFPELVVDKHELLTRFLDPSSGEPIVDLMRPIDLYEHAFDNCIATELGYLVPNLEMAIASKFRALVSRNRPEEKLHLDASDLIQMVKRNHAQVDRDRLRRLGESIFAKGGEQLLKMVDDVIAGRRLRI